MKKHDVIDIFSNSGKSEKRDQHIRYIRVNYGNTKYCRSTARKGAAVLLTHRSAWCKIHTTVPHRPSISQVCVPVEISQNQSFLQGSPKRLMSQFVTSPDTTDCQQEDKEPPTFR